MKPATLLTWILLAAVLGAVLWLHGENRDLRARLEALEGDTAIHAAAEGDPEAATGAALRGASQRRAVAELEHTTQAMATRMQALEKALQESAAGPGVDFDPGALTQAPAFGDAVREVVLEMARSDVDFRARIGQGPRVDIPKNAPFAQVAEALKLDAVQEAQMSKDLQSIQTELFALLSEERDDGVVPMDVIVQAEALDPGDPRRASAFVKLFTLQIPGSEETYMQRAVSLVTGFRKRMDGYLRPAQRERVAAVEVDWFSIKFD